jgi:hypothetical protein
MGHFRHKLYFIGTYAIGRTKVINITFLSHWLTPADYFMLPEFYFSLELCWWLRGYRAVRSLQDVFVQLHKKFNQSINLRPPGSVVDMKLIVRLEAACHSATQQAEGFMGAGEFAHREVMIEWTRGLYSSVFS